MKILLSATRQIGSVAIRFATFGKFSHIDIFLDDETLMGAHLIGGIKKEPYSKRLKVASRIGLYEMPTTPKQDQELKRLALATEGVGYDYYAIIGWVFRKNWDDRARWFCSEWGAWLFREVGAHVVSPLTKVKRIVPRDFEVSPALNMITYVQGRNSVREWANDHGILT